MRTIREFYAVATRCGTCEHMHYGPDCADCEQAGHVCPGWAPHPADVAADAAQEHRELIDRDGAPTLLDPTEARSIGEGVILLEDHIHRRLGWGALPVLGVMYGAPPEEVSPSAERHRMWIETLILPAEFWPDGASAVDHMIAFTDKAKADPDMFTLWRRTAGIDPTAPALAWTFVLEGRSRGRRDRVAVAADVDQRLYSVTRDRDTDKIKNAICTREMMAAVVGALVEAGKVTAANPESRRVDGIPAVHAVVARLVAMTTDETERRHAKHA